MILRLFRWAVACFFVLFFLVILHEPFRSMVPEVDLWSMGPAFSYHLESRTGWRLWAFLLGPEPSYLAFPVHKISFWLLHLFRLPLGAWGVATALIHAANAFCLSWLCRSMGLSRRASFLSGLTFLCLFIHFHAIVWLPGSQHVLSLSSMLITLLLFFSTERRIQEGRGAFVLYSFTLLSTAVASLQNAALLAPLLMGATILAHPASPQERLARYLRWVPAFMAASLYPIVSHSISYVKPLISAIASIPLSPPMKILTLFSCVGTVLALVGVGLRLLCGFPRGGRVVRILLGGGGLGLIGVLVLRDSRQIFLPYNALSPFIAVLSSFLNPFTAALRIDSALSYHYVTAGISAANLLLAILLLAVFYRAIVRHKRRFLIFGVWYVAVLLYLLLHRHVASSMPFQEPSRYFMYVTPIFCVVFCSSAVVLTMGLARRMRWRGFWREAVLILLFGFFWVPNLLAVRVALLRGRLAATYYIYDDIRTVQLIQGDLVRHRKDLQPEGTDICVTGVGPLAFQRKWSWPVPPERVQYRLFLQVAREAWSGVLPIRRIRINEIPAAGEKARLYRVQAAGVIGPEGPLGGFSEKFNAGVQAIRRRRTSEAAALLEEAARQRPFLLNYLLTPKGRLSDLSWVIGRTDLEDWLTLLGDRDRRWSIAPVSKWEQVQISIRSELDDYKRCLFYLAFLRWRDGRTDEALFWLSRLRFLESDVEQLTAPLLEDPLLLSDPNAAPFLAGLKGSLSRLDLMPWRKNDYAFGRWLARILLGWDIRSRWDRQFPEAP